MGSRWVSFGADLFEFDFAWGDGGCYLWDTLIEIYGYYLGNFQWFDFIVYTSMKITLE